MLCGALDGRGVWGRMGTCISTAESLFCLPETITTLLTSYTAIQKKSLAAAAAESLNRVRLCATPQTAAHQAPLSLGFSRQGHWSGLPVPSPVPESKK